MKVIGKAYTGMLVTIWRAIKDTLLSVLNFVLSFVFQFWPVSSIAHHLRSKYPKFWTYLMGLDWVKKAVSFAVTKKFGNATTGRPHPHSMAADYPTWHGFQDRTITARHLPADHALNGGNLPDIAALEELFLRKEITGHQIDDIRSNLLFSSFAQWFTDSFLRTSHKLVFDEDGNVERNIDQSPKRYDGRAIHNESNHEIDLCQIYGMNEAVTQQLRIDTKAAGFDDKDRGCLRSQMGEDGEYPEFLLDDIPKGPKPEKQELELKPQFKGMHHEPLLRSIFRSAQNNKCGYDTLFAVGIEHGNSTMGNSLFNVIFLRQHNWVARKIAAAHSDWDDEKVFQLARNTTIVLLLKVVVSDYIRQISPLDLPLGIYPGMGAGQDWYRPNRIHIEFNLLYRWHGLVPDLFPFLPDADDAAKNFDRFRHNNKWLMDQGVAATVDAFSRVPAGRMTMGNTPKQLFMVKRDTLQLMRSAKLASFNAYRTCFNLEPVKSFEELTGEKVLSAKLSALYDDDIEKLEWYIGMVCEKHAQNMIMGDMLFYMVAHDAFTHAITNPLLAEGVFNERTFGKEGWEVINKTSTLDDILARVAQPTGEQRTSFSHLDA